MAAQKMARPIKCDVEYPGHILDPREWLTFIELKGFSQDWSRLGMNDDDLFAMQVAIQTYPKGSPVIQHTGGLRKLRFATKKNSGRKKPIRVGYVYFPEAATVLLVVAYAKNEMDNISPADKKAIRSFIQREDAILSKKAVK